MTQGGNLAGATHGYRLAGSTASLGMQGGNLAGQSPESQVNAPRRGVGFGGNVGANYSPTTTNRWGGTYGLSAESAGSLLEQDGFVLVLERDNGNKKVFAPEEGYQSIKNLSITEEVNAKSSWQAEVPPDTDLYNWPFSRVIAGYQGDRLFHGVLLPVESGFGDSITLGGFGPLWHATKGELSLTYPDDHPDYSSGQEIPSWRAIEHAWKQVSAKTDGRVRGYPVQPAGRNETIIPGEGQEFSGTPLEVMQRMHTYANMAFAIDHSEPEGIAVSFTPGEEQRAGRWQATDYDANVDPDGYANRVVVYGAEAPDSYPYDRLRGVAQASQQEIDAVADGRIIEETVPKHDLTTETACEEQAKSTLAELRGNYTITGSVTAAPVHATPGYTYRVEEFDTAAPDIFAPVRLPLQSVEHSYGINEAQSTLKFETPEGVTRSIRQQVLPEGVSLDMLRQSLNFETGAGDEFEGGLDYLLDYQLNG